MPARWQQFTNTSSGTVRMQLDLARTQERAVRQHDAARVPVFPVEPFGRLAVAGDVHDPPLTFEHRVDHRLRVGARVERDVEGARPIARSAVARPTLESSARATAIASRPRAEQSRISRAIDRRVSDDQHGIVGSGVDDVLAERRRAQLAQQLGADRPGHVGSLLPAWRTSSSSHGMPAVLRSTSICVSVLPPRNDSISLGTSSWNSVRPICGSLLRLLDAAATRLRISGACVCCARTSVRARLVSIVKTIAAVVAFALADRGDEVVIGAAIARLGGCRSAPVPRTSPVPSSTYASGDAAASICSARHASPARSPIELDDVQAHRPAASAGPCLRRRVPCRRRAGATLSSPSRSLASRTPRAISCADFAGADAGAAAADERRRQREEVRRCRALRRPAAPRRRRPAAPW